MHLFQKFWSYFREVQPPIVRFMHLIMLILVLMQMVSSKLISFEATGQVSSYPVFFFGSWSHFSVGIVLFLAGLFFVVIELNRHGVRYFFPYLWGDFSQIKADLKTLRSGRLPNAATGSLAAVVQGLGLGALVLTAASGLGWLLLWQAGVEMAESAISFHEGLTGLVQAYVIGHGGFGLLHIILWTRAKSHSGSEVS